MYNNNGHIRTVGGDGGDVADPASSNTTVISTNGTRSRADSRDQQPLQAFERLASTSVRKVLGSQTSLAAARKLVATKAQQLMACIVYGGLSVFTSLLIKAIMSIYPFDFPFTLIALQLVVASTVGIGLFLIPRAKLAPVFRVPSPTWQLVIGAIPHSAAYVGNLIIGFIGLEHVNIPLFLCLRRTTLVFVLLSEYMVLGKHHTSATVGCVGAMVVGAMLASWDSLSSVGSHLTPTMLGFVFVGNVSTALYLALAKSFVNKHRMPAMGMMAYQSIVGLPFAALGMLCLGEFGIVQNTELWEDSGFIVWFVLATIMGVVVTIALLRCNSVTSPLACSVTGAAKDVFASLLSVALFADFVPTLTTMAGLGISFGGSLAYSIVASSSSPSSSSPANAHAQVDKRSHGTVGDGGVAEEEEEQEDEPCEATAFV